jgi:hypothetical protein
MRPLIIFFLVAGLFSCQPPKSDATVQQEVQADDETVPAEFTDVYKDFFTTVKDADELNFNRFIHPQHGLVIIESPGALPKASIVTDIAHFRKEYNNKPFFDFDRNTVGTEMIERELPILDCEDFPRFWSKTGTFTDYVNPLERGDFWKFLDVAEEEKEKIANLVSTIEVTVVNTANYNYHFSKVNGRWYITFIDMRVPCSA